MSSLVLGTNTISQPLGLANSVQILCEKLQQNKIVGLGEAHWFPSVFEYWQNLVLHDDVLDVCQDIALEAGNQRFQQEVNDYINGCHNTTERHIHSMLMASIVFPVWLAPYYLNFFRTVRQRNERRKQQGKSLVRLHVMEPEFLWRDIRSKVDYLKVNGSRDEAFFHYVEQHFVKANKPVIAIMGARHLLNITQKFKQQNFAQLCRQHLPNTLFTVWPHIFKQPILDGLVEEIEERSQGVIISTRSSRIESLDFSEICPMPQMEEDSIPLPKQVDACLLVKGVGRVMQWDTTRLSSVDVYDILHRAQFLNDKQQQLIHRMIQG